jgi:adenosylhomocysteine nucleosidase
MRLALPPVPSLSVPGRSVIGILSAIPPERARLHDSLVDPVRSDLAGRRVAEGHLDDVEVVVAEAGVGKVNAAIAVSLLVERYGCRCVVFTGVAGGLDPSLAIGDVVIANHLVQHDTGVLDESGLRRYQPGHVPFFNPTLRFGYTPSAPLMERVRARLGDLKIPPIDLGDGVVREPELVLGRVLTGDQFVDSTAVRDRLHRDIGGVAVDMEGAAVAQTAEALRVDYLVIRALSDLAGEDSPVDFSRFLPTVAENSVLVLRHLLPVL